MGRRVGGNLFIESLRSRENMCCRLRCRLDFLFVVYSANFPAFHTDTCNVQPSLVVVIFVGF